MTPGLERKLRYGSEFHSRLLDAFKQRYELSYEEYSDRHSKWKDDEEKYVAYVKETDADRIAKGLRDEGEPQQITLMMPYTYAIVMTMHTYLTSVFLGGRDPIFQYEGTHGEGEHSKLAVESLVSYQVRTGEMLVPLYIWLMDMCKYGRGVVGLHWDEEVNYIARDVEVPLEFMGIPIGSRTVKRTVEEEVYGYVGNRLYNVRPYNWFPDPRVSALAFQKGEFVIVETDSFPIIDLQMGEYINKEVAEKTSRGGERRANESHTQNMPDYEVTADLPVDVKNVGTGNVKDVYIRLIPKEWGLASRDREEKWHFTVWNDRVIIDAEPLGLYHDRFPFQIIEQEIEGYQLDKRSTAEVLSPLQDLLDWLINTHMYSVRSVVNNNLVVDPSMIVMKDLEQRDRPGLLIRAKPKAYGSGLLDKAVHQLRVADVTQTHMADVPGVMEMMQRASGVTDQIMGMIQRGGRPTAQQIRTETAFGVNRIKTVAEWNSALGFSPLARMLLQNSQQFYDLDQTFKRVGDNMTLRGAEKFIRVTPEDIAGFYDFLPIDGTLPVDRYAQANLWRELLATAAQIPGVLQQYDLGGIFAWIAQLAGMKGVQGFKLEMSDFDKLKAQLEAGNLVSQSEVQNGAPGAEGDTRFEERAGSVAEPGQVSGMGTTG